MNLRALIEIMSSVLKYAIYPKSRPGATRTHISVYFLGDEDDFGNDSILVYLFIEFMMENLREKSAWWCPMSTEIKADELSFWFESLVPFIKSNFFKIVFLI